MRNTIVWKPKTKKSTQMAAFARYIAKTFSIACEDDYQALHQWSVQNPGLFWSALCDFFNVSFDTPAIAPLNPYQRMQDARWFEGATFNFAEKLLAHQGSQTALICIDERGSRQTYSFDALREEVKRTAAGLRAEGVKAGDCVAAVLPNSAYAIIAMLATTSIGAIWSSCSLDFGADAILERFAQIQPKILFLCDGYTYQGKPFDSLLKMQSLVNQLPCLQKTVVCPFLNPHPMHALPTKAVEWSAFQKDAFALEFASLPFAHPIYILFSSGTTGKPKGIVHGAGGTYLQHLKELALHTDMRQNDNLLFYTTCGWMMWNWMVSTLAIGATLTLYEGSALYPTENRLFEIIADEKVTVFGTSAKFLSVLEKKGVVPNQSVSLPSLRCILSTGSPLLAQNYDFVYRAIKEEVQLCSISGGTDILSCFALGNPLLPVYRGELQCIGLGMDVAILNENGEKIWGQPGELTCATPFPSMPLYFWGDTNKVRYTQAYFAKFDNVWTHGDRAEITPHHGLIIYGRSDTVLNPGGVRIGTAEIYHQIEKINAIVDSVVIGQPLDGDVRIVLFVQLQKGLVLDDTLQKTIRQTLRDHASPRHVPAVILQVPDIPRTFNGKVVELAVRDTVEGKPISNLSAIANPQSLAYFTNRIELQ